MKNSILQSLADLQNRIRSLKRAVAAEIGPNIAKLAIRNEADAIATSWVEELRSPLEHKFRIHADVIRSFSDQMKRLHVLSRPNNRKASYITTVAALLNKFDDRLILPIKQGVFEEASSFRLEQLVPKLPDAAESDYLREAISCANEGFSRAAVVMGWCATIDRIQRKLLGLGLETVNKTSSKLKNQESGRFKYWKKEFTLSTLSELQTVFDTDLIVLLEGMELIDGNQAERLRTCFQYRNHSAHPGAAPVEQAHLVAFFTDVSSIVLTNPRFAVAPIAPT